MKRVFTEFSFLSPGNSLHSRKDLITKRKENGVILCFTWGCRILEDVIDSSLGIHQPSSIVVVFSLVPRV